jgi:putative phosphoribosyl transferase
MMEVMIFANRTIAGTLLGVHLQRHANVEDPVVIGIPRGGAITAAAVAHELDAPCDVVVAEPLVAPHNPDFPVATVDEDGTMVTMGGNLPLPLHLTLEDLADQAADAVHAVRRAAARYRMGSPHIPLAGRDVIVVDDGILSGLTACAVALYARGHGARTVIAAAPVASHQAIAQLEHCVDSVFAIDVPQPVRSIGDHYRYWSPVPDAAVRAVLHHTIEPRLAGRGSE